VVASCSTADAQPDQVLVIACGALAREIQALKKRYNWQHLTLKCLDASLHNQPHLIPEKLRAMIDVQRDQYSSIFVAYADCGTGGRIDAVLKDTGIERLSGPHCYSFYAGEKTFNRLSDEEPGTFYLTDFLVRHFRRLIIDGLKLDVYPDMKTQMFGNYKRVIYLSQTNDKALLVAAREAADYLQLQFEHLHTRYGGLEDDLKRQIIATG
jgi:hypothetical protein